ncbi:LysR family transcriptional regulator [Catenovulum sediminis]|uniref:LysR family transcriptional regulator n=1 Tax=Catenovulum sediminis TaxID=1740262 RepID=UPI00117D08E3|nr:LysR family transcriptional regulator [Catenovulum sediminis]
MGQLEELENFVRIVEAGGIGKVAEQSGIAKSAVSRRLSDLEARLGTKLINRTTRKSSLTEAGMRCYEHATRLLDATEELQSLITQEQVSVTGTLRISVPLSFGLKFFPDLISEFNQLYPKIKVELELADHFVDLVAQGFDLAVRIGELKDSSMRARKLFPVELKLVASPQYLKKHGEPKSPDDLMQHKLLKYTLATQNLNLTDQQGQAHSVRMQNAFVANNGDFLNQLAINGKGITISPNFICDQDLKDNKLVHVLKDYSVGSRNAYACYPATQYLPVRVRVFIDFLVAYFND